MSKTEKFYYTINLLAYPLLFFGFVSIIGIFIATVRLSIKNIIYLSPDSNLALLVETLDKFWLHALAFGLIVGSFSVMITCIIVLLMYNTRKTFLDTQPLKKILGLFILSFTSSFLFIILMAATKPESSSITLTFLPYIGSIIFFGYTLFFKENKQKDKS
ncbi:hypothetical protein ACWEXK_12295 [Staphylococcus xylosus]|uniref:hypothetical protein n=1 Tax=Staphylococcus xylosus TaxID=1288 RepID=UPI000D1E5469|nr:hypothetical protein [Staphylococcus xylosus]PTI18321.1 hypothetical protein BU115_12120 [Staphylococcus xylosus]HDP5827264.1 hypothetical protein [Staphylococcus aureus]